jgi:hypothetical protein
MARIIEKKAIKVIVSAIAPPFYLANPKSELVAKNARSLI